MASRKKTRSTRSTKNTKTRSTVGPSNRKTNSDVGYAHLRSTVGGPARAGGSAGDALSVKFQTIEKLAADMPYNVNKTLEHGDLSRQPPTGQTATPADSSATGSTLTETSPSAKVGAGTPQLGANPNILPLDRVRADSSGQTLTTNQGVRA